MKPEQTHPLKPEVEFMKTFKNPMKLWRIPPVPIPWRWVKKCVNQFSLIEKCCIILAMFARVNHFQHTKAINKKKNEHKQKYMRNLRNSKLKCEVISLKHYVKRKSREYNVSFREILWSTQLVWYCTVDRV